MKMKKSLEVAPEPQAIAEAAGTRPGSVLKAMNYENLDAEKILTNFGTFGFYQMFVYAMANLGFFLFACETMIFSLISEPEFECHDPELISQRAEIQNVCEYFSLDGNKTFCRNFEYPNGKNATLNSEFDLVCDNDANTAFFGAIKLTAEMSMSTFMLGSMIFTPILSQLADRYGRRITYLLPLWMTVIANVGCAMAPTYYIFLICRFVAGVGTAGIGTIGFVIILETVAPAFRSHTPFVSTIIWVAGYCTVGVVHMAFESWRVQYFILSAPFLLTFSFYWLLPESLHWMVTHEKHEGVSKYIKRSSKYNRRHIDLEICRSSTTPSLEIEEDILESSSIKKPKDAHRRNFLDILTNMPILFQLSSHCFIMIVMNFTYWALSLYSTDLHENKMVGYFLSGLVELPAAGAIFALAYIGRRSVTSMALLAQAAAMFIACFFPGKNATAMTLFLLVKVFNSVAWVAEPLLVGEMSPTSTRNMMYGIIGFVGETGSIIAPYFNRLKTIHEAAPAMAVAVLSLVAGLLALCSPETKDKAMPEDINDFDPGEVYRWIFGIPAPAKKTAVNDVSTNTSSEKPLLTPPNILAENNDLKKQITANSRQ